MCVVLQPTPVLHGFMGYGGEKKSSVHEIFLPQRTTEGQS